MIKLLIHHLFREGLHYVYYVVLRTIPETRQHLPLTKQTKQNNLEIDSLVSDRLPCCFERIFQDITKPSASNSKADLVIWIVLYVYIN